MQMPIHIYVIENDEQKTTQNEDKKIIQKCFLWLQYLSDSFDD